MSIPSRVRRISAFGCAAAVVAFGALLIAGRQQQQAPVRDLARELSMSVGDNFTLIAVGDLIIARPIAQLTDAGFAGVVKILQKGDVTFGNFEGSAIDTRRFTGYPAAEFGGVWIIGPPEVAKDLKTLGFDMVSRANNHATDWGVEGMRLTSDALDAAGVVHAGVGETRAAARAARFFETDKGRVAVVSMASSFTPMSRAMDPVGEASGRPGLSGVRTTRHVLVTPEELEGLRKIRDEQPRGAIRPNPEEPKDAVALFGTTYKVGDRRGYTYTVDPVDEQEILRAIRHAKLSADFVIATIHAHDPGNWSEEPADFLPILARKAIDAGADAWVGHGPHQLRGIEIYKGKPIFHSLGDFIFQLDLLQPVGQDLYEQFKKDPGTTTDAEFSRFWTDRTFEGDVWYQSVIAESRFANGRLAGVRLHAVDLGFDRRAANRGVPRLARPEVARTILERLQRLSSPYGTTIAIEQHVGVIRLPAATSSGAPASAADLSRPLRRGLAVARPPLARARRAVDRQESAHHDARPCRLAGRRARARGRRGLGASVRRNGSRRSLPDRGHLSHRHHLPRRRHAGRRARRPERGRVSAATRSAARRDRAPPRHGAALLCHDGRHQVRRSGRRTGRVLPHTGRLPRHGARSALVSVGGPDRALPGHLVRLEGQVPAAARTFIFVAAPVFNLVKMRIHDTGRTAGFARMFTPLEPSPPYVLGDSPSASTWLSSAVEYGRLGFTHILPRGIDHVLFVLGLYLLSVKLSQLL